MAFKKDLSWKRVVLRNLKLQKNNNNNNNNNNNKINVFLKLKH